METTEKSLMPHLSVPVERKLLDTPAKGEAFAAVAPSFMGHELATCLLFGGGDVCYKLYPRP